MPDFFSRSFSGLSPRFLRPILPTAKCSQRQIERPYAITVNSISSPPPPPPPPPPQSLSISSPKKNDPAPDRLFYTDRIPGLKTFKPITPGRRHLRLPYNPHLYRGRPYLPLTYPKKGHAKGGRNHSGRVTVRHRGGGVKRRIRTVDFKRDEPGPQDVIRIEYDPGRSAHIALLKHRESGSVSYIVAPVGMRAGDIVQSYRAGLPQSLLDEMGGRIDPGVLATRICIRGNCLPIQLVPPGTQVYNVGSNPFRGAVFCRSAGTYATVVGRDESEKTFRFMVVKLSSGETRKVAKDACATIGVASNPLWQFRRLGKAGRSRWLNKRPAVRGVAMNAGAFLMNSVKLRIQD
jgi:ribosomal protein L2